LYGKLSLLGEVTILSAPSWDPDCSRQKYQWLQKHLKIKSEKVIMGNRKELLAGNGILIDDSLNNVNRFKMAGGDAILIPSTWNTRDLTFRQVWNTIKTGLVCKYE